MASTGHIIIYRDRRQTAYQKDDVDVETMGEYERFGRRGRLIESPCCHSIVQEDYQRRRDEDTQRYDPDGGL